MSINAICARTLTAKRTPKENNFWGFQYIERFKGNHSKQINLAKELFNQTKFELSHNEENREALKPVVKALPDRTLPNYPTQREKKERRKTAKMSNTHPFRTYRSPACKCETAQKRSRKRFKMTDFAFKELFLEKREKESGVGHR